MSGAEQAPGIGAGQVGDCVVRAGAQGCHGAEYQREVCGFVRLGSVANGVGEKIRGIGFNQQAVGGDFAYGAVDPVIAGIRHGAGKGEPGIQWSQFADEFGRSGKSVEHESGGKRTEAFQGFEQRGPGAYAVNHKGAVEFHGQFDLAVKDGFGVFRGVGVVQRIQSGFADRQCGMGAEKGGQAIGPIVREVGGEPGMYADGGNEHGETGGLVEYGGPVVRAGSAIDDAAYSPIGGPLYDGPGILAQPFIRQVTVCVNEGWGGGIRGQFSSSGFSGASLGCSEAMVISSRLRVRSRNMAMRRAPKPVLVAVSQMKKVSEGITAGR